jgi:acyl-coenzyme A synthetase/AMP-(fatty) acid ligase
VVVSGGAHEDSRGEKKERLKAEILRICRQTLSPYKIPAIIRIVPALDVAPTGKLVRHA